MKKAFILCFSLCISYFSTKGQETVREVSQVMPKVRISSYGMGAQTLGLSEFNKVFTALDIKETPDLRLALYFSRFSLNESNRIFTGFSISAQTYSVVDSDPGELSYTFAKQALDFNLGYYVFENDLVMVPIYGGAGLSFMIFNSHISDNNTGKDFSDILINGAGRGVYNLAELGINGSLITGIDFKLGQAKRGKNNENVRLNLGLRMGAIISAYQTPGSIEDVSGIPNTDRVNYFVSLHLSRFLFPCN